MKIRHIYNTKCENILNFTSKNNNHNKIQRAIDKQAYIDANTKESKELFFVLMIMSLLADSHHLNFFDKTKKIPKTPLALLIGTGIAGVLNIAERIYYSKQFDRTF